MGFTKLFTVVALLVSSAASAQSQLPNGRYSGFVSNNTFNEWCRLNRATLDFRRPDPDGAVQVFWEETGFAQSPAAGFCENRFDATLVPTGQPNVWDVRFNWNWDLYAGRAILRGAALEIDASYTGFRTDFRALRVRLTIDSARSTITYDRRIDRWGPTLWATGTLHK